MEKSEEVILEAGFYNLGCVKCFLELHALTREKSKAGKNLNDKSASSG